MAHVPPSEIRIIGWFFLVHVYSFPVKSVSVAIKHLSIRGNGGEIAEVFGGPFS